MNLSGRTIGLLFLSIVLIACAICIPVFAASQTFTGTVGDAMCGAKHVMPGDDASCTKGCISKGSKYALLVGDKVYVLDIVDKTLLDTLEKRAGAKVTITGTEKNNTITVISVKAAR
jgi:hypothetical protein